MKKINKSILIFASVGMLFSLVSISPKVQDNKHEILKDNTTYNAYLNIDAVTNKGRTYYVSPEKTAKNAGSGLTKTDPESIYLLENEVKLLPGDTVILLGDVYKFTEKNARIMSYVSGEFNKYITIKSETSKNVVLDFSSAMFDSTLRGVTINGDYIYWSGVDICGAGDNGMYIGGDFNIIENSQFYNNRDSGLQLGRAEGSYTGIAEWPSFNYIRNCTSFNNYDNETYGENADGFAAKLTIGFGNIFDGCIAYRNSDDGWDLYAKNDSGNIGTVIIYNCVAFENGFIADNQETCNSRFPTFNKEMFGEKDANGNDKFYSFTTRDGDGNGFKLGGSIMEGDTYIYNSLAFNNKMHGITDNSNPGVIFADKCTSFDNGAVVDDNKNSKTYGQIISGSSDQESGEECANIDLSRQTYSYNVLKDSISLKSEWSTSIGGDAIRGSVTNSFLGTAFGNKNAYKIVGDLEADTKSKIYGDIISSIDPNKLFAKLPVIKENNEYHYNISGLNNYKIHEDYRNSDLSINMHDILKVKDYSLLLGEDKKIGSELDKVSFEQYKHFDWIDYSSFSSADEMRNACANKSLILPINGDAVYQDFKLPLYLYNVDLSFESSDTSLLEVSNQRVSGMSGAIYLYFYVNRDLDEAKKVDLKVTFTFRGVVSTKTFALTIMPGSPAIGDVSANGIENGRVIVDAYTEYKIPEITVVNGNDNNGKILSPSNYNVSYKYFYATDKNSQFYEVKGFTTSKPGVFRVVATIKLKSSNASKQYSYDIYVASSSSNVDFENNLSKLVVTKNGFDLSGNLTSATGKIFVYTSNSKLDNVEQSLVMDKGVANTFRNDSINFSFEHSNNSEYYVYYLISNLSGNYVSQVYEKKVAIVSINSENEFNNIFGGSTSSSVIYTLNKDLDFENINCTAASSKSTFSGLFNGLGHTIKNVKIAKNADGINSLWYKVEGGTIENVKFENISLNAGNNNKQVGIIGTCYGGTFYNIAMKNINSFGKERVSGLIGQVFEGAKTIIECVSLINDETCLIKADSKDCAGIIGLCQTTSAPLVDYDVEIKDVLVVGRFEATTYCGGVIGRFDDQKPTIIYHLKVDGVVVEGSVKTSSNYCGGVIGGQVGSSVISFTNCISLMDLYHKGSASKLVVSEKNCSPIMGRHSGNAIVTNCASLIAEYETNFEVVTYKFDQIIDYKNLYLVKLGDNWTNDPTVAPYYFLIFKEA